MTKDFERQRIRIDSIREIDENFWFGDKNIEPTCRAIVEHVRLIEETDLSYPIILSSDGRVMDGMHRVAKALLKRQETIEAVQFKKDPKPDYEDVEPNDLPY